MSNRKPTVMFRDHTGRNVWRTAPTYAYIKSHMKAYMDESFDDIVEVNRTRRGEWGEWFERWERTPNNKLTITKQTWL